MNTARVVAAAVLSASSLALPAAVGRAAADQGDHYTLSTDATSALPGGQLSATGVDDNDTGDCRSAPFTLSLDYVKVGGDETTATVATGTTDATSAGVSATFTVPADATSTDASDEKATLSLAVECSSPTPASPSRSRTARSASTTNAPSTTASLTVSPFSGSVHVSRRYAERGENVEVDISNCKGGPIRGTFISRTEVPTRFEFNDYDVGNLEASGNFDVPDDAQFGHSAVTALCWQTSYGEADLYVEHYLTAAGGASGAGTTSGITSARPARPVSAVPTFTG